MVMVVPLRSLLTRLRLSSDEGTSTWLPVFRPRRGVSSHPPSRPRPETILDKYHRAISGVAEGNNRTWLWTNQTRPALVDVVEAVTAGAVGRRRGDSGSACADVIPRCGQRTRPASKVLTGPLR